MADKQRFEHVAVVMGGVSAERDISLRSGEAAVAGLRASGYVVTPLDIRDASLSLPPTVDAVFLALHGTFGEDGTVQHMLDELGLPFTGSGADASRLAMDKVASKARWMEADIPTAPYRVLTEVEQISSDWPVVVKPVSQGSSIGVHLVHGPDALEAALLDAFAYDARVMVEAYIPGRELTVGLLGEMALPVVEIVAPDGWYGFGAKYTDGQTRYVVPAEIAPEDGALLQAMAARAFSALGCCGFGRVDFRWPDGGKPMVLEVNTIPGLTKTSLLPKAAASAGISFAALCGRIMETAGQGSLRGAAHA